MRTVTVIILLAFAAKARAQLANELLDRHKGSHLHHTNLDDAMLAKPGHLAMSPQTNLRPLPLRAQTHRPQTHFAPQPNRVCSAACPATLRQSPGFMTTMAVLG